MRLQLFEFEDLSWLPGSIRQGGTDYLRYFLTATRFYEPVVPLLDDALEQAGETEILDLCSGGGGVMGQLSHDLNQYRGRETKITLSDKFPNINAFEYIKAKTSVNVDYIAFKKISIGSLVYHSRKFRPTLSVSLPVEVVPFH